MYTTAVAKSSWGGLAFRGIIAVLFGLAAIFWPGLTLVALVYLFSIFILISGLMGIVMGITSASKTQYWLLQVVLGIVELGFGIYFLRHIHVTTTTFLILAGIVLVVRGLFEVAGAFLEKDEENVSRSLNAITGLVTIVAGVWLMLEPKNVGVAFVWILGVYALVVGCIEVALAVKASND